VSVGGGGGRGGGGRGVEMWCVGVRGVECVGVVFGMCCVVLCCVVLCCVVLCCVVLCLCLCCVVFVLCCVCVVFVLCCVVLCCVVLCCVVLCCVVLCCVVLCCAACVILYPLSHHPHNQTHTQNRLGNGRAMDSKPDRQNERSVRCNLNRDLWP
jgi:hypothetical protein